MSALDIPRIAWRLLQRVHFLPPGQTVTIGDREVRGPAFLMEPPDFEMEPVEEGAEYPTLRPRT